MPPLKKKAKIKIKLPNLSKQRRILKKADRQLRWLQTTPHYRQQRLVEIAKAMALPIRRNLDYTGVVRASPRRGAIVQEIGSIVLQAAKVVRQLAFLPINKEDEVVVDRLAAGCLPVYPKKTKLPKRTIN